MADTLQKAEILLIDDSMSDARLFQEILRECGLADKVALMSIGDSDKALKTLTSGNYRPDIILLDLNLPKKSGIEVLREIKTHELLRTIPVIVMTTSDRELDIKMAYQNYANAYILKPADISEMGKVVQTLYQFWFNVVCLKF